MRDRIYTKENEAGTDEWGEGRMGLAVLRKAVTTGRKRRKDTGKGEDGNGKNKKDTITHEKYFKGRLGR